MATTIALTIPGDTDPATIATGGRSEFTLATGNRGPAGADGAQGPAPSGTGLVSVTSGVLDTPSTLSARVAADAVNLRTQLGLGTVATFNAGTTTGTIPYFDEDGVIVLSSNIGGIEVTGTQGIISTAGDEGSISTTGGNASISVSGADASIFALGANGTVSTIGQFGNILTYGANATIRTYGANAFIESRNTFRLNNGTFTTTLSHSPSGNRAISYPDANGTLLISSLNLSGLSSASTARTNLGAGTTGASIFQAATQAAALAALATKLSPSAQVDVTSNATPANISGMSFSVAANTTYFVLLHARVDAGAGGYDVRLDLPSLQNGTINQLGFGFRHNGLSSLGVTAITATNIRVANRGAAQTGPETAIFMFRTAASGGTANFQFSQSASNAANSALLTSTTALIFTI